MSSNEGNPTCQLPEVEELSPIQEPKQVQTEVTEADLPSLWECMPPEAFVKLFQKLDCSTLRDIRQVCSSWKQVIDLEAGLQVKIDEKIPGNKDFASRVKIREARILKLDNAADDNENLFLDKKALDRLVLAGPVSPFWFNQFLPSFHNVTKLILRGGSLTTYELSPGTDEYSTVPIIQRRIFLPELKSLEIIVNEFSFPFFLPLAIRLRDPQRAEANERDFTQVALRSAKNISFLLHSIQSPRLKMLQVYYFQKPGLLLPPTHNWRYHPLETFLERHRHTLKNLYLPEYEGKHEFEHQVIPFPTQLSKLCILITCFIGDREENRMQDSNYWKELISSQTKLSALDLQVFDFPQEWIMQMITGTCINSCNHLTYIDLMIQMEGNFEMDFRMFEVCRCLQVFKLSCREDEAEISNFCSLPSTLKKVRIAGTFIILPPNPEEIKKFKNLIMLEISSIRIDETPQNQTLAVVREFIHLRKLNYLGLNFDNNIAENSNPDLRTIVQQFSLFWDHRFHFSGVKINYTYEVTEGWSDETFDEYHNDRDYINQREPESMASWLSTPTGMDDDPRVILLQNIPLLLRTIARQEEGADDDDENADVEVDIYSNPSSNDPDRLHYRQDFDDDDDDDGDDDLW